MCRLGIESEQTSDTHQLAAARPAVGDDPVARPAPPVNCAKRKSGALLVIFIRGRVGAERRRPESRASNTSDTAIGGVLGMGGCLECHFHRSHSNSWDTCQVHTPG
jgi:hypothetical protein